MICSEKHHYTVACAFKSIRAESQNQGKLYYFIQSLIHEFILLKKCIKKINTIYIICMEIN